MDTPDIAIISESYKMGKKTAPNRLVSQPMEANDGLEDGRCSDRSYERYKNLARGNWGIVVVESISVTGSSLGRKNGLFINRKNIDSFKRLVGEFKTINNDSLILFQITHSGSLSGSFSQVAKVYPDQEEQGDFFSAEEIEKVREQFVKGALLSEEAGADGIDFKLCHGYLGTELIRPSNKRNDKWGGSFENRTRFLREGIEEIKSGLQRHDFILGSRISMYEGLRGGCGTADPDELIEDLTEMRQIMGLFETLGMDYVNVSAGAAGISSELIRPVKSSQHLALQQFRYTKEAKTMTPSLKVIGSAYSVFGETAPLYAAENISKGYTDFAGLGRQSFADPLYPKKLFNGEPINYCKLCGGCSELLARQVNTGCIVYDEYYRSLLKDSKDKKEL